MHGALADITIYTVLTDNYDILFSPRTTIPGVRYVAFCDSRSKVPGGWERREMPPCNNVHPRLVNRHVKVFGHRLLSGVGCSLYLDANLRITGDLRPLLDRFLASGAAMGLFRHPDRRSIREEAEACERCGRFDDEDRQLVGPQLEGYARQGFPDRSLTHNAVILRRHGHPGLAEAMDLWWEQLTTACKRDQISLPYVLWKTGLPCVVWDHELYAENPYFESYPHRRGFPDDLRTMLRVRRNDGPCWNLAHRLCDCLWAARHYARRLRELAVC